MTVTSNALEGIVVGLLLGLFAVPAVASRLARGDDNPWIFRLAVVGGVLKLAMAPLYIFVIDHFYGGVADYRGYLNAGSQVGTLIRHGQFSFQVGPFIGDGATSIITGIDYAIVGNDQLGVFFLFAFASFVSLTFFYRAFRLAMPQADRRRYGALIFLLPSLLFWTSDVGKDAIISFGLGIGAIGAARILNRTHRGFLLCAAGLAIVGIIRPHVALMYFVGVAAAYLLTRSRRAKPRTAAGKLAGLIVIVVGGLILIKYTERFLGIHSLSLSAIKKALQKNAVNTGSAATGQIGQFGSSRAASTSLSPLAIPVDIYDVLIRPLPFRAHGITQLASSAENLFIVSLFVVSWRRVWAALRSMRREPYVMLCAVYSLIWVVLYASIGNLGILAREKSSLMPALLILVCWQRPSLDRTSPATPSPGSSLDVPPDTATQRTAAGLVHGR